MTLPIKAHSHQRNALTRRAMIFSLRIKDEKKRDKRNIRD